MNHLDSFSHTRYEVEEIFPLQKELVCLSVYRKGNMKQCIRVQKGSYIQNKKIEAKLFIILLKEGCLVGLNLHSCNHVKQRPSPHGFTFHGQELTKENINHRQLVWFGGQRGEMSKEGMLSLKATNSSEVNECSSVGSSPTIRQG